MLHTKLRPGVSDVMFVVSASQPKDKLRHRELQHHRGGKGQTPPGGNNVLGPSYTSTQRHIALRKGAFRELQTAMCKSIYEISRVCFVFPPLRAWELLLLATK